MFKPLQRVKFELLKDDATAFFDSTVGNIYEGVFIPNGAHECCEGVMVDDAGGLSFVDDAGDICTLSTEGDAERIRIIE